LLTLLDNNFTNFLRVGSLKKIAKPILPYSNIGKIGTEAHEGKTFLSFSLEYFLEVSK